MASNEGNNEGDEKFNVTEIAQNSLKSLMAAIRQSSQLPKGGDDYNFYSSFQVFNEVVGVQRERLLRQIEDILSYQGIKGRLSRDIHAGDLEEKSDVIIDANDVMLERVGSLLDEASGLKQKEQPLVIASYTPQQKSVASWNKTKGISITGSTDTRSSIKLLAARAVARPQLKFSIKPDNRPNVPFVPLIREKPNSQCPLPDSLIKLPLSSLDIHPTQLPEEGYVHPYQTELENLKPNSEQLAPAQPVKPHEALDETPLVMIETKEDLQELCSQLAKETVIAVDLEAHSYRSYQGITCLMQISSRTHDYIVDTLSLREELQALQAIFTDPNVTKVFHGADMDVLWLQRDLGLYLVSLFDTYVAAQLLNYPRKSLAALLSRHVGFEPDKQFQLADWRIRPLPAEFVRYARQDTHYLLYVMDCMKQELAERNLLTQAWTASTRVALKVYRKPICSDASAMDLMIRSKKVFNRRQQEALSRLYHWRDSVAREEDESLGYVLPNHMLLQIAENLPREEQGVLACCNPIPPLIRRYLNEIHKMLLECREIPLINTLENVSSLVETQGRQESSDLYGSLITCPHDWSRADTSRPAPKLPTTCDSRLIVSPSSPVRPVSGSCIMNARNMSLADALSHSCSLHEKSSPSSAAVQAANIRKLMSSPFSMYLKATGTKQSIRRVTSVEKLKFGQTAKKLTEKAEANVEDEDSNVKAETSTDPAIQSTSTCTATASTDPAIQSTSTCTATAGNSTDDRQTKTVDDSAEVNPPVASQQDRLEFPLSGEVKKKKKYRGRKLERALQDLAAEIEPFDYSNEPKIRVLGDEAEGPEKKRTKIDKDKKQQKRKSDDDGFQTGKAPRLAGPNSNKSQTFSSTTKKPKR